jgi:hypothetical protein
MTAPRLDDNFSCRLPLRPSRAAIALVYGIPETPPRRPGAMHFLNFLSLLASIVGTLAFAAGLALVLESLK